ncbi:MAG: TIGR04282 family arsenosugar biosynthesis glycosyltransferase [Candidatus Tectomicrobia bacterium]|uniref:TIGR04282 family arsenosugar biosynthesis glycosyltransferase n=1 Tax=Tectimicrobiota bacterium TaxID=2528274 RepID=A0A932GSE4_UNCTE|nr:TIGR04282 family arsenosugar biosynthesis glycosyltransferase [Candidatus Tectomicrobia bacterium]
MAGVFDAAVAMMAKVPRPGEVKTRLCPTYSYEEAAELYRCFLLDKIEQVKGLEDAVPVIVYTPENTKDFFESLAGTGFTFIPQQGSDLGERLAGAFKRLFALGYRRVIVIDTDTPTLPLHYLQGALGLLCEPEVDVVLGPSEDGGYYLIGLCQLYRELFDGMVRSTAHVLSETIGRARAKGLKVACLSSWFDVDTPEDLQRLKASLRSDEAAGPQHTKRFLLEHSK